MHVYISRIVKNKTDKYISLENTLATDCISDSDEDDDLEVFPELDIEDGWDQEVYGEPFWANSEWEKEVD